MGKCTYDELIKRIESYPKGFQFTLPYYKMTEKVKKSSYVLMGMAKKKGLIQSISIGMGFDDNGDFVDMEETFKRL